MKEMKKRRIYRIPPCPLYDVTGLEKWLTEEAAQGWFLAEDGFTLGVAALEEGTPRPAKYSVVASLHSTSMWSDTNGEPTGEELDLSETYGWKYCGKRGEFFIYRAETPDAREMETDPEVKAMALKEVQKRQRSLSVSVVLQCVLLLLIFNTAGTLLWNIIQLRTWLLAIGVGAMLWNAVDACRDTRYLRSMQKALRTEGTLENTACRRRTTAYYFSKVLQTALLIVWLLAVMFHSFWLDVEIPLEVWQGEAPFATLADYGGQAAGYETDDYMHFNTVEEWSDWLAPRCILWDEHAQVTRADGLVVDGIYSVKYCETRAPWMAKELLREWEWEEKHGRFRGKHYRPLPVPAVQADEVRAYMGVVGQKLSFRKGCVAVEVEFIQFGEPPLPLEEWAQIAAGSVS